MAINKVLYILKLVQLSRIVLLKRRIKGISCYYCIHVDRIYQHVLVENRLNSFVILFHDAFILEFLVALLDALHVGVDYFTVFLAVAVLYFVDPSAAVELEVEVEDENG